MTKHLLPVGQPLGLVHAPADGSIRGSVRLGTEYVDLEPADYRLWRLAFDQDGLDRLLSGSAVDAASGEPVADGVTAGIDRLLDQDLLVPLDTDRDLQEPLREHVLVATAYALGNTREDPDAFTLATVDGVPAARVGPAVYLVWTAAGLGDVWRTCELVADESGDASPEAVAAVAAEVVTSLPVLLGTGTARLDRA